MLPEHVSIILLSATVPNTREFADWVGCVLDGPLTDFELSKEGLQENEEEGHLRHLYSATACASGTLLVCRQGTAQDCR
jgi:hypothetical protein